MWTDASVFLGQARDPAKSAFFDKVGVAPFPAGPKRNAPYFVTSWAMAIAKQSRNKDIAYKFLTWATSQDVLKKAMMDKGLTVARNSPWKDPAVLALFDKQLAETATKTIPIATGYDRPLMTAVGEARDAIGEVIVNAIETGGTTDLSAAARAATKKVNDLLDAAGELGK